MHQSTDSALQPTAAGSGWQLQCSRRVPVEPLPPAAGRVHRSETPEN